MAPKRQRPAASATRPGKPLVPPPNKVMSRKRARVVTTQFHKLTRQLEAARAADDDTATRALEEEIQAMGGRREYQRASQTSTQFHSTSKWVLGYLATRNGWLYGVPVVKENPEQQGDQPKQRKKKERRPTRILEIGAINTELLDAATVATPAPDADNDDNNDDKDDNNTSVPASNCRTTKRLIDVRAIDLHSMVESRIEKADFLTLPVNHVDVHRRYDVLVCSMVLNCVPTASQRGEMVCRLYHFLRPQGLLFLTIPRTCLALSPYMDKARFAKLLTAVGLELLETKESPKIAFYVCRRRGNKEGDEQQQEQQQQKQERVWDPKWTELRQIRRGKKFTNDFAIVLSKESFHGETLIYPKDADTNSISKDGA